MERLLSIGRKKTFSVCTSPLYCCIFYISFCFTYYHFFSSRIFSRSPFLSVFFFLHFLFNLPPLLPIRVQMFPAWPTFKGDRNKTTLLFFNIVSLYFNTLFNRYINLTIDCTIYPSQHFPFGAAFVCQAENFWTLLHTSIRLLCLTECRLVWLKR